MGVFGELFLEWPLADLGLKKKKKGLSRARKSEALLGLVRTYKPKFCLKHMILS